jgi:glycopeptide antibiotics resistance protein
LSPFLDRSESQIPSPLLDPLAGWMTLAAILVILVVALFPFDFSAQATVLRRQGFFLDWFALDGKHWLGWLLNILFFTPFGFGWAWWTRVKGWRHLGGWIATVLAGLMLSLTVEWLQLFLPPRASSWDDVLSNTLGTMVAWLFFQYFGGKCLRFVESAFDDLSGALEG